ncbi:MAG: hypothetical protein J0L97_05710 [Alphaproteobacteria bacterium]|nr:hypothetical protein [Alphaproteobacteria bacterium]
MNNNILYSDWCRDLRAFIHTDLLYYLADSPPELTEEQRQGWEPMLAWAENRYGVTFLRTQGVMPLTQPEAVQKMLEAAIEENQENIELLYRLTRAFGSLILALAVLEKRLDAAEAFRLSRLDEDFQKRAWGVDDEAEAREKAILADIQMMMAGLSGKA